MLSINRRGLLASAASTLAAAKAEAALYLIFGSPTMRVGTRQFSVPNNLINLTTQNSLNSRMTCFAPTGSDITGLILKFPGFGFDTTEQALPTATITVTASVEYPAGVFHPVTKSGSRNLTITAGEAVYSFDFLPIVIPAGAAFYAKTYATWSAGNFWLCGLCASDITTDWTNSGTGLADNTLTTTVLSSSSPVAGYGPSVYASFAVVPRSVGVIGDSIGYAGTDGWDPVTNSRFMERAMLNVLPIMNLCKSGDTFFNYLLQTTGRHLLLDGFVDRLICEYGTNDTFGLPSLATLQARAQSTWAPFIAAGVKVWQTTLTPRTTSSDGWSTRAGQTVVNAGAETLRLQFNAWIRANYLALGLSGYLDFGRVIDPTDSGVWNADGTTGTSAAGFCTLSGGAVSACALATYTSGTSNGSGYPVSSTVTCTVRPYAGDSGVVPTITAAANGSGVITGFTVVTPGSGLTYAPMVAPNGAWTGDGTHPNARGYNEMIYQTGLGPTMFA